MPEDRISESGPAPVSAGLFLGGPTAVGKSEIAMHLARRLDGEIISVDSMQVYRGLDIGTAKPSAAERSEVVHHLVDVVDPGESFDAARFLEGAAEAVAAIRGRGRVPIFCGGTTLYFQAFLGGLGEAPSSDPVLRAELEQESMDVLLSELKERDPGFYEVVDRRNPRRVIRAVEVMRLTGRPFSALRAPWKEGGEGPLFFVCRRSTGELGARIGARVDRMFAAGLVEETRGLLRRGLAGNRTALQAIGYRQVVDHLEGGVSLEETIELVKVRTRQFAKRQMTWFRRRREVCWVDLEEGSDPGGVADSVARRFGGGVR